MSTSGAFLKSTKEGVKIFQEKEVFNETSTLTFYDNPPKIDINIEEMYSCANQRYCLLRLLADLGDCEIASQKDWIPTLMDKFSSENMENFRRIVKNEFSNESERETLSEWDTISHFILRTACARLFESLKWFIKQEVKLFYLRWFLLCPNQQNNFLNANEITLKSLSEDEISLLHEQFTDFPFTNNIFKTKFSKASRLVKTRTVFLTNGWVYFNLRQAVYPLAYIYEDNINKSLRKAKAKYDYLDFDPRYSFLFKRISEEIKLSLYKFNPGLKSKVDVKDLTRLSVTSFPLCMSILHHSLIKDFHLRNGGRFQYNLFLKGIGVTLYDSIRYWRDIFTRKMSLEQFSRHYLYGIRHNYGMLGKQADYPPLSCARIMESSPGPLDHHGCPFVKGEKEDLIRHLKRFGINEEYCTSVLQLVASNLPQQACAHVFELKHGVTNQEATAHPNIYFEKSRNLIDKQLKLLKLEDSPRDQNEMDLQLKLDENSTKSLVKDTCHSANTQISTSSSNHQGSQDNKLVCCNVLMTSGTQSESLTKGIKLHKKIKSPMHTSSRAFCKDSDNSFVSKEVFSRCSSCPPNSLSSGLLENDW